MDLSIVCFILNLKLNSSARRPCLSAPSVPAGRTSLFSPLFYVHIFISSCVSLSLTPSSFLSDLQQQFSLASAKSWPCRRRRRLRRRRIDVVFSFYHRSLHTNAYMLIMHRASQQCNAARAERKTSQINSLAFRQCTERRRITTGLLA